MSGGPFDIEDFVASLVRGLMAKGDPQAISLLLDGAPRFAFDESDWGKDFWRLIVALPGQAFHSMTADEITSLQQRIALVAEPFFDAADGKNRFNGVSIVPYVSKAQSGWREEAARFVTGQGITNQGRAHSQHVAAKEHEGLLFRSHAEITLYEALKRARVAVAPLPVFIRVGKQFHRLEPDFIVVHKGLTFVVEVDGDTYHRETPADADARLLPLTHEGVEVRRLNASDVATPAKADEAVKMLVTWMDQRKAAR